MTAGDPLRELEAPLEAAFTVDNLQVAGDAVFVARSGSRLVW